MRLSADPRDEGYTPEAVDYDVFLDGKPISLCLIADEEAGEITVIKMGDHGRPLTEVTPDGFRMVRETMRGKVEIRRKP